MMTNHAHLLLTPSETGMPSRLMQSLGRRYVQYANCFYRCSGSLREGRYKSSVVNAEDYLLARQRCIELNPVRADSGYRNKRERRTAVHLHQALRAQGYPGGYGRVCAFIRRWKAEINTLTEASNPDSSLEVLTQTDCHNSHLTAIHKTCG